MRIIKSTSLLLGLFFLCAGLRAQQINPGLKEAISRAMQSHFGERDPEDPGAVLIINNNGNEIYRQIFGSANLETQTPITDSTVFEAASVTKQFTAAAILKLIDEGKLALTDDIRDYFPELPDYGSTITVRHLLTHTSGLRDWRNVVYLTPWPTGECLYDQDFALEMIFRQRGLNFKPGDQYRYSNSGYDLLGSLVERLTGTSFAEYVQDNLLKPAGMTRSRIRGKYTDIVKNRANGYLTRNKQYLQGQTMDESYGAAGLQTTAGDLQKWNRFIHSDRLSSSMRKMRLRQFVLNDGTRIPYANGGVEIHRHNGQTEIRHGGLISGYRAWLAYYPEKAISVSYMSNDREISSSGTADAVADVLFGVDRAPYAGKKQIKVSQALLENLKGKYWNLSDHSIMLELKASQGMLMRGKDTVKFTGKKEFILDKERYEITRTGLVAHTATGRYHYKKVSGFSPEAADLEQFTGVYFSPDCGVEFTVSVREGKLISSRSPYDQVTLYPQFKDENTVVFRTIDNGLRNMYQFSTGSDGMELSISIPRAADIRFIRQ